MAHRPCGAATVTHTGHVAAQAATTDAARMMSAIMAMPVVMVIVVVMPVVVVPVAVIAIAPIRIPAPVVAVVVGIAPVPVPAPIAAPIGTITPVPIVVAGVVIPIERVVAVHIDVGVATAIIGVIIVIIASRRGRLRAEALDARREVGIIVGLGSGVHHTVGVGHRLRGLINGLGIADVVLAVGIIGLVVVFRTAADAGTYIRSIARRHVSAFVVGRIVGVVVGHLPAR